MQKEALESDRQGPCIFCEIPVKGYLKDLCSDPDFHQRLGFERDILQRTRDSEILLLPQG